MPRPKRQQIKWPVVGHDKIIRYLTESINEHKYASAYLFFGQNKLGKLVIAKFFVKSLLCTGVDGRPCNQCENCVKFEHETHPDVTIIKKRIDQKNIGIEEIRDNVIHRHFMSSVLSPYKVTIIDNADLLSREASNCLLKTLEEPITRSIIILIAEKKDGLPQTIISRCQRIEFFPVSIDLVNAYLLKKHPEYERNKLKSIAKMSLGRIGLAEEYLKDNKIFEKSDEEHKLFINLLSAGINARFKYVDKILSGRKFVESSDKLMQTIDNWMITLRDLLLYKFDLSAYQVHESHQFQLPKENLSAERLIKLINNLFTIKKQLAFNINPKLALENFLLNL